MTKNTPRIFISLLLMLLCIGILPVSAFASDGDYPDDALPSRVGYVYGSYLTVTDAADSTVSIGGITLPFDEKELTDLWQLLVGSMTGGSDALTPDGNLTLIDDIGSSTKAGKQFITLESKNGITAAIPRQTKKAAATRCV